MPPDPAPGGTIRFRLDGREAEVPAGPGEALLPLLRDRLGATGVRLACARGVCGACTVLLDGEPAAACSLLAFQAEGREVETVAGLSPPGGPPHPLQAAFARRGAFQCGYCTGGFLMLAKALLARDPSPSRGTVVEWVSSNVCRCTGYGTILEAVQEAAAEMRGAGA